MKNYWAVQISVCAVAAVALPALGVLLLTLSPDEPGRGALLILVGTPFLGCLIWLVRSYRRLSPSQRAIYAWVVTQRSVLVSISTPRRTNVDRATMSLAARARDGKLSAQEIDALQALDPGNPYPGR